MRHLNRLTTLTPILLLLRAVGTPSGFGADSQDRQAARQRRRCKRARQGQQNALDSRHPTGVRVHHRSSHQARDGCECSRQRWPDRARLSRITQGHPPYSSIQRRQRNIKDNHGWSILMKAAYYGHAEIVDALLARGANVNLHDGKGKTALAIAQEKNRPQIVQLLRKAGAEK